MEENNKINSIRLEADLAVFDSPKNATTKTLITFRSGDGVCFDVVFFNRGELVDCADIISATLEIFDVGEINEALPRQVKLLVSKSVSAGNINKLLTKADAKNGKCHFSVKLTSEDSSMKAGVKYLKLYAQDLQGDRITFAAGWIRVEEVFNAKLDSNPDKEISIAEALKSQITDQSIRTDNIEKSLENFGDMLGDVSSSVEENSSRIENICNALSSLDSQKANLSTSLLGYGIEDAYTKEDVNTKVEQLRSQIDENSVKVSSVIDQVSTLQTGKTDKGSLHFNGGVLSIGKSSNSEAYSHCFTMSYSYEDFLNTTAGASFVGTCLYATANNGWFLYNNSSATNKRLDLMSYNKIATSGTYTTLATGENIKKFFDGTPKKFVVVRDSVNTRLYLDNALIKTLSISANGPDDFLKFGYRANTTGSFTPYFVGQVSDVAVFNFDITAEDAPYTINDYQQGKSIPLSLLDLTAEQRAEVALENYTFNGEVLDYSGNGRHGTITGSVKGDNDTKVETLFEKISARIANQTNG